MNLAVLLPDVKLGLLCFFSLYITGGHTHHKGKVLLLMQDQDIPLPLHDKTLLVGRTDKSTATATGSVVAVDFAVSSS